MTTAQQLSAIQDERDDAREDLREALTLVNAKVGRAEDSLHPERMIENHSIGAALIAAAIGFMVGSTTNNKGAGPIMIAALFGFALSRREANPKINLVPFNRGKGLGVR
jgi:hypothetical protein